MLTSEFYRHHMMIDDGTPPSAVPLFFPLPDPASIPSGKTLPFRQCVYGPNNCGHTDAQIGGEGVTIDEYGRAWFTLAAGTVHPNGSASLGPNHSQVVMYDLANGTGRIYYLPGSDQSAFGVTWDEDRNRIWIGQQGWPMPSQDVTQTRLTSFDPEEVCYQTFDPDTQSLTGWNFLTALTATTVPTSVNCDYATPAACNVTPPAEVGTCSNVASRACVTAADCVLVELVCPPPGPGETEEDVDDAACYHDYALPGTANSAGLLVAPDGAVWFANYFPASLGGWPDAPAPDLGFAGRSIGRLDTNTGAVQYVPFATPRDGTHAVPWELQFDSNGDLVTGLLVSTAFARLDMAQFATNPSSCLALTSSNPADDCTLDDDPSVIPPLACTNPCVTEYVDGDAFVPCVTTNPCALGGAAACTAPERRVCVPVDGKLVDVLGVDVDQSTDALWYSRGYLIEQQSEMVPIFFPPLPKLYPGATPANIAFCNGYDDNPLRGLGEEVALDPATGDIWSKTGCDRQVYKLVTKASVP